MSSDKPKLVILNNMCNTNNCKQCEIIKVTKLDINAYEFIPSFLLFELSTERFNGNDLDEFSGFDLNVFTLYFKKPKGKKYNTRYNNFKRKERERLAKSSENLIFDNLCKINNLPLSKVSDFIPKNIQQTFQNKQKQKSLDSIQPFETFQLPLKKKKSKKITSNF